MIELFTCYKHALVDLIYFVLLYAATLFYIGFDGDSMVTSDVSEHGTKTTGPNGE